MKNRMKNLLKLSILLTSVYLWICGIVFSVSWMIRFSLSYFNHQIVQIKPTNTLFIIIAFWIASVILVSISLDVIMFWKKQPRKK